MLLRKYNDKYWRRELTSYDITITLIKLLRPIFAKRYAGIMHEFIMNIERPKILEVGCGIAATLRYLKRYIPTLTGCGIDTSRVALNIAQKRGEEITFLQADVFDMPFKKSFNLIYSVGLIEHYSRKQALDILLQKKSAVVEGGYIGEVVPAKIGLLNLYEKCLGRKWLFETEIPFTRIELKELMEKADLKNVKVYYIYGMTLLGLGRK